MRSTEFLNTVISTLSLSLSQYIYIYIYICIYLFRIRPHDKNMKVILPKEKEKSWTLDMVDGHLTGANRKTITFLVE